MAKPKTLLDFFKDLTSEDENVRFRAAVKLIKTLNDKNTEEDWDYAYGRLLKGLASMKAQKGFSMALAEVLRSRQDSIKVSDYMDKCDRYFDVPQNAKGHEERGYNFGRLFAIECLISSPLIHKATDQEFSRVVDRVLGLATHKAWLRESCFSTLCGLLDSKNLKALEKSGFNVELIIDKLLKDVEKNNLTFTSEGVALYLTLGKKAKAVSVPDGWNENDPLAKGNLPTLSKALKEVPVNEEKQKGNWKPQINFVWGKLMEELFSSDDDAVESEEPRAKKHKSGKHSKKEKKDKKDKQSSRTTIDEFWKVVVDEGLFANSSSNERKYWGFEIFALFVKHAPDVNPLFTPNLMRTLMNQLCQQDRILNKSAKRALGELVAACKDKPDALALPVVQILLKTAPNFDQRTKTKTVEGLLPLIPAADLPNVVAIFTGIFLKPSDDEKPDQQRQWAIDQLLGIVKQRGKSDSNNGKSIEWIESIIDIIIRCGYFVDAKKGVKPAISEKTAEVCTQRLNSIMSVLVGTERDDKKSWAYYTLDQITALETKQKLRLEFEGELLEAKNKSLHTLEKIKRKRLSSPHADSTQLKAFELLFSLVLLQVYSADSEAALMLNELQTCYHKYVGKDNYREGDDDDDIDATQVLTEILLSFLSQKSALLRRLSETVWGTFTSQASLASLGLLYNVLDTRENLQGQQDMFEGEVDGEAEEEDGEEGDDDEEEQEEDSEEEDDDDDEDEEEEDEEDEAGSGEADAAEQAARQKLAAALGINNDGDVEMGSGSGEDSSDNGDDDGDDDDDNDDEESMDDEQMMALDDKISEIFREQRRVLSQTKSGNQKKQDAKDAKENVVQFKARVLDLLEIYIKNESNLLVLSAIVPLLRLMRTTKDKPLGDRTHALLKQKLCKPKQLPPLSGDSDVEQLLEILSMIHEEASKSTNKPHSYACNQCSIFVSKVLLNHDTEIAPSIVQVYSKSLNEFVTTKNSKIMPAMFNDFVNWVASRK